MEIDEQQIRSIVEEVVRSLAQERTSQGPSAPVRLAGGEYGVFQDINSAIDAATVAYSELMELSLAKRSEIIDAIRKVGVENAKDFGQRALEETGMGRLEDKIQKKILASKLSPGVEDLITRAWSGDHGLSIEEMAPCGVIAAVLPSTHPVATMINNAISMIAAGNSVVFNPHPGAKKVSVYALRKINLAIEAAGGPPNLIVGIENPTIESAQALFAHPKVDLIVVTGGPGVVKAAMGSGKRVIAAGPGNPPVVVDETADLSKAAKDIIAGAVFDNNILCIAEKEIIVVESVADKLKSEMKNNGAYELTPDQVEKLAKVAIRGDTHPTVNRNLVGRDASVLAGEIGLVVGSDVQVLIGETSLDHIFVQEEQMMPFLPIVRARNVESAIDMAIQAEHGYYHTAIMHSKNVENMSNMARRIKTTIFVKNGPSSAGLGVNGEGYISFSIATTTGEGVTSPRTFTRQRRCVLVDYFRII